jgi:hypothetical protein
MRWVFSFGVSLAAGLAALGCGSDLGPRLEDPSPIPGMKTRYIVAGVVERGDYLDAVLVREDRPRRFFFPASETCRAVVRLEAPVDYESVSVPGTVESPAGVCDAVGIGSLAEWRDRLPRRSMRPVPTGNAVYRSVYQDADLTLVRGRFPYASQIGWVGGWDTLAALPRGEACDALAARGNSTIEFRVAGPQPYRLSSGPEPCPIDAFVKPLGGAAAAPEEGEP